MGLFHESKTRSCRLSVIAFKDPVIHNAKQPLQIPTYDGSGQVVHPSVIDFQNEYGIDSLGRLSILDGADTLSIQPGSV